MDCHHESIYINPRARNWHCAANIDIRIRELHQRLPNFVQTPLISLDAVAKELGVRHVFVKDESSRAGLPAFKILGASWATYRAVARAVGAAIDVTLEDLSAAARKSSVKLFAATDGNHGRAVARMAKLLGIQCHIFVPSYLNGTVRSSIAGEGARVIVIDGDYDYTVLQAKIRSEMPDGLLIQDTAFEGYTEIAQWIVDGYSTMMLETEEQVAQATGLPVNFIVVPVGVGSLAQSAVTYWKSKPHPCTVLAVEPDKAACLKTSLINGTAISVPTGFTIMSGLNCGTVSSIAWPILRQGVDVCVSIPDAVAEETREELRGRGVDAGPCGAAALAALRIVARIHREAVGELGQDSVVVLLSTEGNGAHMPALDSLDKTSPR